MVTTRQWLIAFSSLTPEGSQPIPVAAAIPAA
jgi:hypothetical protein